MTRHRRPTPVHVGVAIVLVAGIVALAWVGLAGERGSARQIPRFEVVQGEVDEVDHDYVIPPGTAERLARGETVDVLPRELQGAVGELIRLRNEDGEPAFVGPFYVPAGVTQVIEMVGPGVLEAFCTIHPSGQFTISVAA